MDEKANEERKPAWKEEAEEEARRDLEKSYDDQLADVYVELLGIRFSHAPHDSGVAALRKAVALFARMGRDSQKAQEATARATDAMAKAAEATTRLTGRIEVLTRLLVVLTVLLAVLTTVLLVISVWSR